MKKITFLITLFMLTKSLSAQVIENPSFDSIYIGAIDRIYSWVTSDSWPLMAGDTVYPLEPDSQYNSIGFQFHKMLHSVQPGYTGAFDGPFYIRVFSDTVRKDIFGNPFPGFIVNGNSFYTDTNGYIDLNKCGTPFTTRPDKLRGHYQFEDHSPSLNNYPRAQVLLKKFNSTTQQSDTVGYGTLFMQLYPVPNWRLFEIPITYLNNLTPDSIVVAFIAPNLPFLSTFSIDSLGFEYSSVDIENIDYENEIEYYVSENILHIPDADKIISISIYDITGKKVYGNKVVSPVNLAGLSRGSYIFKAVMKNGKFESNRIFIE